MELRIIVRFSAERLPAAESRHRSCAWSGPDKGGCGHFDSFGKRAQSGVDDG